MSPRQVFLHLKTLDFLLFSASSASRETPVDNATSWSRSRESCATTNSAARLRLRRANPCVLDTGEMPPLSSTTTPLPLHEQVWEFDRKYRTLAEETRSPPAIAIPQPVLSLLEGDLLPQAPQMYPKLLPMVSTWRQHHDRPEPVNGKLRSTTALSRSAPTEVLLAFLEAHSSLTPSAAQNVRRPWKTEEPRRTAILCFCCFGSQVLRHPHRLPRSAAATSTTTTRILSVIEEGMCLNAAAPPAAP